MKREMRVILTLVFALVILTGAQAQAQSKFKDFALPEVWQGHKETIFGALEFDHGMPTKQAAETVYAKLDAYRATELFLWSQPIVSFAKWRARSIPASRTARFFTPRRMTTGWAF